MVKKIRSDEKMYLQNLTEYNPTRAEEKVLEVLLNPTNRMKSVTEICKIAKISRETYYNAFEKPEFTKLYNDMSLQCIKRSIGPVINAFIHKAKRGSYTHGKVILEMAGLYTEKKKIDVTTPHKLEDLFPGKKENV